MLNDNKTNSESQTVLFSVYVIWCRCTNQFYVGVTGKQVHVRISQHKHSGRQFIGREIQRIGWEGNWDYWVVEESVPAELISERERYWIKFFDSAYPNGYNRTIGGITLFKHTEGAKATMSAAKTGENHPNYGKHRTEETKEAIRQANLGKHHSEESKEAMRQAHLGRHHSEETKSQMSADRKGENHPMYGKKHTEESKAKMRQSHLGNSARKGIPCSEETKARIREKAFARAAAKRAAKAVAEKILSLPIRRRQACRL